MPSNALNASNAKPGPPAYCHWRPPLPFVPPFSPPPALQGWARWTDLAPDPLPVDVAIYIPLPRIGTSWDWQGDATQHGFRLQLTLQRLQDPNPYAVTITIWTPWGATGNTVWNPVVVQFEPAWDTGLLRHVYVPALDFQEARVQQ